MVRIAEIEAGSIAEELNLEIGTRVVRINGERVRDGLDLTFLLSFGVQLAMYATPIIYPMSSLSEQARNVLWWNPIAHVIECFKYGFLGFGDATLAGLAYTTAFTALTLFLGIILALILFSVLTPVYDILGQLDI